MRRPLRPWRSLVVVAALVAPMPALAGCGAGSGTGESSGTPSSATSSTSTSTSTGQTIDITVADGRVTPDGDRVKAELGKPITLRIDADEAGELHVHSTPEQEIEFPAGTSTRRLTIHQPGIVDVEDHALDRVVVQLQVS